MPLYNTDRDISFHKSVSSEMVQKIISTEIYLYKISIRNTDVNIYGESDNKFYDTPIRLYSIVRYSEKQGSSEEHMITYNRNMKFSFLKQELINSGITVEVGDIIYYDGMHFEIDLVSSSNYWSGRNSETALGVELNGWDDYGYAYSIEASAHLSNMALNLEFPAYLHTEVGDESITNKTYILGTGPYLNTDQLANWIQPDNPEEGDAAIVKFTDNIIVYYIYSNNIWNNISFLVNGDYYYIFESGFNFSISIPNLFRNKSIFCELYTPAGENVSVECNILNNIIVNSNINLFQHVLHINLYNR